MTFSAGFHLGPHLKLMMLGVISNAAACLVLYKTDVSPPTQMEENNSQLLCRKLVFCHAIIQIHQAGL